MRAETSARASSMAVCSWAGWKTVPFKGLAEACLGDLGQAGGGQSRNQDVPALLGKQLVTDGDLLLQFGLAFLLAGEGLQGVQAFVQLDLQRIGGFRNIRFGQFLNCP